MRVLGAPRHAEQPGPFPGERRPELPAKVSEAAPKPAPGAARGGAAPGRPDHAVTPGLRRALQPPAPALLAPQADFSPCRGLYCFGDIWGAAPPSARSPCLARLRLGRETLSEPSSPETPPPRATRVTPDEPRAEEPRRGAAAAGTRNAAGGTAAWRSPGGAARLCWLQR